MAISIGRASAYRSSDLSLIKQRVFVPVAIKTSNLVFEFKLNGPKNWILENGLQLSHFVAVNKLVLKRVLYSLTMSIRPEMNHAT